jgi:hypothetical protein
MPGWQIPGVPPVPTVTDLLRMVQLQTELMTELPETMTELTRAVRGLAETVETAKETVAAANRVTERLESLLDELQDPVHGLRPGIQRITEVLEAPVIGRLPAILESVERTVHPVSESAERIRKRLARFRRR